MTFAIYCYDRKNGNLLNVLKKDFIEYSEWTERARIRGYRLDTKKWSKSIWYYATNDNEKCDFAVSIEG